MCVREHTVGHLMPSHMELRSGKKLPPIVVRLPDDYMGSKPGMSWECRSCGLEACNAMLMYCGCLYCGPCWEVLPNKTMCVLCEFHPARVLYTYTAFITHVQQYMKVPITTCVAYKVLGRTEDGRYISPYVRKDKKQDYREHRGYSLWDATRRGAVIGMSTFGLHAYKCLKTARARAWPHFYVARVTVVGRRHSDSEQVVAWAMWINTIFERRDLQTLPCYHCQFATTPDSDSDSDTNKYTSL